MKKAISLFIGAVIALNMSLPVYTATSQTVSGTDGGSIGVSIGTVSEVSGYIEVPVYANSTDYEGISNYTLQVSYDSDKIDESSFSTESDFVDQLFTSTTVRGQTTYTYYGSSVINGPFTDTGTSEHYYKMAWTTTSENVAFSDGELLLFYMYFIPSAEYSVSDFTAEDFSVKIITISSVINGKTSVIYNETSTESTTATETTTETTTESSTTTTETTTETTTTTTTETTTETTTTTTTETTTETTTTTTTETTTETTTTTTTESTTETTTETTTSAIPDDVPSGSAVEVSTEETTVETTTTEVVTEETTETTTKKSSSSGGGGSSYNLSGKSTTTTTEASTEETSEDETNDINTEEAATEATTEAESVKISIGSNVVTIGDSEYEMDAAPYIQTSSQSTLVPLRFVAIALLGEDVENADSSSVISWDAETKTASVVVDGKVIKFTAGSNIMNVGGNSGPMDNGVVAEITDGRMYIPFRALGEAMGIDVDWDGTTKTAIYSTK